MVYGLTTNKYGLKTIKKAIKILRAGEGLR